MAIKTKIEYCDSTGNLMAGCQGCELYNPSWPDEKNTCYAERITRNKAGQRGWPERFNKPAIFSRRIEQIISWRDLTGTNREDKPWLNGFPRIVFLNDMGDMFTESLPLNWFDAFIDKLASSPHIYLLLTKRPKRMYKYFLSQPEVPPNFWLGTSITGRATLDRLEDLRQLEGMAKLWVSFEPLLDGVMPMFAHFVDWIVGGAESGPNARKTNPAHAYDLKQYCSDLGIPFFWKSWAKQRPGREIAGIEYSEMPEFEVISRRLL